MRKPALPLLFAALALGLCPTGSVSGQSAILSEMYGRGVHAYFSGLNDQAIHLLTLAIDNGIQDPRAYYFRGMAAHSSGRTHEAEGDWQLGAELEATGRSNAEVGRSLARFQGTGRMKLEEIRQKARLNALAAALERSKQRYGELGVQEPGAPLPATPVAPIARPPMPLETENPFAADLADGQPNVAAEDALEGAMTDPFADDPAPAAPSAPAGADPFGGDAPGADPFGGAAGDDPFGGAPGADPFGGAADDDPFGGN